MKVLFLTTAHRYNDDRIFYHQAVELVKKGFEVKICSLSSGYKGIIDGIEIESYSILEQSAKQKKDILLKICNDFQPDVIICSEPLAIIAAGKFQKIKKTSIIYDITEWYPSFRMLQPYSWLLKPFHLIKFFLIQMYAGFLSTHFIFGEDSKKFPLMYLFPFKKNLTQAYYPDDIYIEKNIKQIAKNKITLCCTGRISKEDGIDNFFKAIDLVRKRKPDLEISILIVGAPKRDSDAKHFNQLLEKYAWENISIVKPTSFETFTSSYSEADICFDLREKNFEYNNSLPIKLFYYAASGKPVIYTNLKAIRNHIDVSKFGYLVEPENSELIADLIINYTEKPSLYDKHAKNARASYEKKYNWNLIKQTFVDFVKQSEK
ncbi:glycosyltransferase [Epilithonimonas zeae]|uniref:Glycosyltransferase involved in cell wall bisynthesis n=1 Tax=Epilithonimonas zeae TaxID=1416779 RepID=A0A1N6IBD0_9FLAO|nr:glycosyltransferase [Epilithonimonas zeae]SIO29313.1 Glycosyltransferase involved in cell wall bisynthesis [Epilithonimonas zeae]